MKHNCTTASCRTCPDTATVTKKRAEALREAAPESDTDETGETSPHHSESDTNSELSTIPNNSEQSDLDHLECAANKIHTNEDAAYAISMELAKQLRHDPTLPPPFDPTDQSDNIANVADGLQWPICKCAVRSCRWTGNNEVELKLHVEEMHQNLIIMT